MKNAIESKTKRLQPLVQLLILLAAFLPASCSPGETQEGDESVSDVEEAFEAREDTEVAEDCDRVSEIETFAKYDPGYPSIHPDGNPYLEGRATLNGIEPTRVELSETPVRVIGISGSQRPVWGVVLRGGKTRAFTLFEDTVCSLETTPESIPETLPPVVTISEYSVAFTSVSDASQYSAPVLLTNGREAYVSQQGDLRIGDSGGLQLNALFDGHLRRDKKDRVLALTHPSQRYTHGILGDETEPTGIAVVSTEGEPKVEHQIDIKKPEVIEGIGAIWEDIDGDGRRDILVTTSNGQEGARLKIFEEDGDLLAESDPIGQGFRWRHQLAIAPFGPDGGLEVVDVRTPHIGGLVEFFAREGSKLVKTAEIKGFSSHTIGSRTVNQAVAADLDSDDHVELLVRGRSRDTLIAVQRTSEGAVKEWQLKLGSTLSTNLAAARTEAGRIKVAAGIEGGELLIW